MLKKFLESSRNAYDLISRGHHKIVFYAESSGDYLFFSETIEWILRQDKSVTIIYITSDFQDPLLKNSIDRLEVIYIQDSGSLAHAFKNISADVFVMTLTDLDSFHLKKSDKVGNYVYIFHSLNSTHMVYLKDAFKNYDVIFSAGDFVNQELRKSERIYNLPTKKYYNVGYGRLDSLIKKRRAIHNGSKVGSTKRVMIAPSWGESCLIESGLIYDILDVLKGISLDITIRPHPMTFKKSKSKIRKLSQTIKGKENIKLSHDILSDDDLINTDYLITDWSGISFEYALTNTRKVIYVDTGRPKCRNKDYRDIPLVPNEISYRDKIGFDIQASNIKGIPELLPLIKDDDADVIRVREELVFNVESSGKFGANIILHELARESVA